MAAFVSRTSQTRTYLPEKTDTFLSLESFKITPHITETISRNPERLQEYIRCLEINGLPDSITVNQHCTPLNNDRLWELWIISLQEMKRSGCQSPENVVVCGDEWLIPVRVVPI